MIIIEKPRIEPSGVANQVNNREKSERRIRLISHIINEVQPLQEDIWFETTEEYGKFFCNETCDAFVVAMLIPAVQTQQDIECDCISEKLLYNLNNEVSFILQSAWKGRRIQIKAKKIVNTVFGGEGIGSGCSLGVDSFASILGHSESYCSQNYCLNYLTNFNVGAFGSTDLKLARESWLNDLEKVKIFADEYGLPLVTIDSNIGITNYGLSFDQVFLFRNASAVLSLQKLFKRYFIASGRTVDKISINKNYVSYSETLLVPLLSTESCDIIVSEADMTRTEKTKFICSTSYVRKHLYVCWKEIFKNEWPKYWNEIKDAAQKNRNCTMCDKCMRTCLTLDLLGCLDEYKEIFDIPQYYKTKDSYIKKVVVNKNNNSYNSELYDLMIEKHVDIPISVKLTAKYNRFMRLMKSIAKTLLQRQ